MKQCIPTWELLYQNSRKGDGLREVLIKSISTELRRGSDRKLQKYAPFYPFVERSPEIAGELLKELLQYTSFGEEKQEDESSSSDVSNGKHSSIPSGTQVALYANDSNDLADWSESTEHPVAAEESVQ